MFNFKIHFLKTVVIIIVCLSFLLLIYTHSMKKLNKCNHGKSSFSLNVENIESFMTSIPHTL